MKKIPTVMIAKKIRLPKTDKIHPFFLKTEDKWNCETQDI